MRFVLLAAILLLVPAGCFVAAGRQAASLESDLFQDGAQQVKHFDQLVEMYPPRMMRMENAAEYLRLKQVDDPAEMTAMVCRAPEGPYSHLFDRLPYRCAEWQLLRSARRRGLLGAAGAVLTIVLLLILRIALRGWPADGKAATGTRFATVGIQAVLALEAAGALLGPRVLLQFAAPGPLYVRSILAVAWPLLYWIERRAAIAFLGLTGGRLHRPRPVTGRQRRTATPHL